ncbi:uncharacterized protein RCC_07355 [Ramularia collo-cygni]|uniref:Uncharacterized protein n=1 Tax=Ramularia collo-cygni TaxID=112498 RepID=A0A2D3UUZ8_9PEZI|nr:uncharacterized protein RCC_07355 [Ramularia collo-cygni]CZT21492.1 uncharacterized protein RCC_07355 [Ramularia collo-cygni]
MPTPKQAKRLARLRDMGRSPRPPRSPSWEKYEIKTYQHGYVYIVDHDPNYLQVPDRSVKQQQHDERCMRIANFFDSRTPYEVICVAFPRGATPADWTLYWDAELATKNADDLIMIHFHGKAWGTNQGYKW